MYSIVYRLTTTQHFELVSLLRLQFSVGVVFLCLYFMMDLNIFVQAFVGVAQDLNAIVIAFRGTHGNRF